MRLRSALILGFGGCLVAGCSLFVSLDGLSSNASVGADGGATDGSLPDTVVADAFTDSSTHDSGPFCASLSPAPSFCDDFDEAPLGTLWDLPAPQDAGTFVLASDAYLSRPFSLLATIPDPVHANDQAVGLTKTFTGSGEADAKDIHCEVDLRIEGNGTVGGDFVAVAISQSSDDPAIGYSSFSILAGPGQWGIEEFEQYNDGGGFEPAEIPLPGLQSGLWRHLAIDLSFATKTAVYSLTDTYPDGTTGDAGSVTASMAAPQMTFSRGVGIGIDPNYAPSGTTQWQSRFDNFWCNFTP